MNDQQGGREPVLVAGGVTAAVSAVLAALWSLSADFGWLAQVTPQTQALVTGAVLAVVALAANAWARARVTPTSAPELSIGTKVTTPNGTAAVVTNSLATE